MSALDNLNNWVLGSEAQLKQEPSPSLPEPSQNRSFPPFLSWGLFRFSWLQHWVFGERVSGSFSELGFFVLGLESDLCAIRRRINAYSYSIAACSKLTEGFRYCNVTAWKLTASETWTQQPHLGPELSRHFAVNAGSASGFFFFPCLRSSTPISFWGTTLTHCQWLF